MTQRWQQLMEQTHGIGVLATIEEGEPRLRPMEFSLVGDELWAATSRKSRKYAGIHDGEHVEVLFMNARSDHARIRGVLTCSDTAADRQRLWALQRGSIERWYAGVDDPNLVVLKIIPEAAEFKSANTPNDRYQEEAA